METLYPRISGVWSQAKSQFSEERLLKEKAAVLSESSLVNTIFYRKEQVQLAHLHRDTILPSRFPIGNMDLLRQWSLDEVRTFYDRFYRPENAALYIVGDIAGEEALRTVRRVFDSVSGNARAEVQWQKVSKRWQEITVKRK